MRRVEVAMALSINSPAFGPNDEIPRRYTCDGRNVSPPLAWTGVPEAAKSLALIVDDPDAPDPAAPKRVFVHWVLYNIPPAAAGLPEGASGDRLPAGLRVAPNDWGDTSYGGPCPPKGRHRYFFRLLALDTLLPELGITSKADLEAAMAGHVLETAELVALYARTR